MATNSMKVTPAQLIRPAGFSLQQTLECGQCFRFDRLPDGSMCGVANNQYIRFFEEHDRILLYHTTQQQADTLWADYFDLQRDYLQINTLLAQDPVLKKAIDYAGGIRILRQPAWEALCSFILSQNNNIKRIKGIIARLCEHFGEPLGNGHYTFPSPQRLAGLTTEDLAPLRAGFRAAYVLDAANKIADGALNLNVISNGPLDISRAELIKIKGVGPKVADCALLFGFGRVDAFPVDVWIKRALTELYPNGFPEFAKPYGGIAQQYIFHYMRTGTSVVL